MAHVKLTSDGFRNRVLTVDGERLRGVTRTTITVAASDVDRCVVEVRMINGVDYEGEAEVALPESTVETLKGLGWTPPYEYTK